MAGLSAFWCSIALQFVAFSTVSRVRRASRTPRRRLTTAVSNGHDGYTSFFAGEQSSCWTITRRSQSPTMPTPNGRTLAAMLLVAATAAALQRPATHSLVRRHSASPATSPASGSTPIPGAEDARRTISGAKDARRAAPLLAAARREGQLSRMQNVEGWRGNNTAPARTSSAFTSRTSSRARARSSWS